MKMPSDLTEVQREVLGRLSADEPKSAYRVGARLPTLRALVKKGYARDVTPPGAGGLFSPSTHFQFIKVQP
jgi:hypothetical protein